MDGGFSAIHSTLKTPQMNRIQKKIPNLLYNLEINHYKDFLGCFVITPPL
jgi:hypothetical protein